MEVSELLEHVCDSKSFLEFAQALASDRVDSIAKEAVSPSSAHAPDANGWENTTIESFLESAVAWAKASNFGASQGLLPSNPWRQFATFLYCGKIYE